MDYFRGRWHLYGIDASCLIVDNLDSFRAAFMNFNNVSVFFSHKILSTCSKALYIDFYILAMWVSYCLIMFSNKLYGIDSTDFSIYALSLVNLLNPLSFAVLEFKPRTLCVLSKCLSTVLRLE